MLGSLEAENRDLKNSLLRLNLEAQSLSAANRRLLEEMKAMRRAQNEPPSDILYSNGPNTEERGK